MGEHSRSFSEKELREILQQELNGNWRIFLSLGEKISELGKSTSGRRVDEKYADLLFKLGLEQIDGETSDATARYQQVLDIAERLKIKLETSQ